MRVIAAVAAAAAVANALPQGVTSAISPAAAAPSGCQAMRSGQFGLAVRRLGSTTHLAVLEARAAM